MNEVSCTRVGKDHAQISGQIDRVERHDFRAIVVCELEIDTIQAIDSQGLSALQQRCLELVQALCHPPRRCFLDHLVAHTNARGHCRVLLHLLLIPLGAGSCSRRHHLVQDWKIHTKKLFL
jgi:ABC-type branched-subunit amino acid transport system ATPase component